MKGIKIRCPTCSINGTIKISEDAIKKEERGLLAVNIPEDLICDHTFIAYVDKNLTVRNYFIPDFQFELVSESEEDETKKEEETVLVPPKEEIDIELIKLNTPLSLLTYILRIMFFKKKILVITDQYFLFEHYHKFFSYITQNTFQIGIAFITPEEYEENPEYYYDFATLRKKESGFSFKYKFLFMVPDMDEISKMQEIRNIVYKFQQESDHEKSLLFLKNDITKIYNMCKTITKFLLKNGASTSIKKIQKYLENVYDTELNKSYLYFLIDTLNNYFRS